MTAYSSVPSHAAPGFSTGQLRQLIAIEQDRILHLEHRAWDPISLADLETTNSKLTAARRALATKRQQLAETLSAQAAPAIGHLASAVNDITAPICPS